MARPAGSLNTRTLAGAAWALEFLNSQEYKDSLMRRIKNDTLDPRVETTLITLAYGKPVERVEAKVENVPMGTLDADKAPQDIANEVQQLAALLTVVQKQEETPTVN